MKINPHFLLLCLIFFLLGCTPTKFTISRLSITEESTIPVSLIIYTEQPPDWDNIFMFLKSKARSYDHRINGSPVHTLNTIYEATVPEEIYKTCAMAVDIAEQSDGSFDPTILPLTTLWNFDNIPKLPSETEISNALHFVDYKKITLSKNNVIRIPEKFGIDLGGIAKGAIVDDVADYLDTLGYHNFLIEAGGDILVSGLKPRDTKWTIAITHPRNNDTFFGTLSIGEPGKRIAVVTSGDYEKYFEEDGKHYHHIIDPHSGYPANNMTSVTVIAPGCAEADALATAVFVLGREKGLALLEKRKETEGLLMYDKDNNLNIIMTELFSSFLQQK